MQVYIMGSGRWQYISHNDGGALSQILYIWWNFNKTSYRYLLYEIIYNIVEFDAFDRKKRLKELREAAKVRRYGSVTPISSSDFVREVTQASAEDRVVVCLYKDGYVGDTEVRFFADEWSEVHQLIPLVNDGETDKKGGYDIILMAETLYSISAQKRLYELIKRCLAYHDGAVYMAAKKYYFGVGGGTRQFLSMIEKDGKNGLYKERIVFVHPQHHP
ncbi:unnamed protein product [Brassica oleracea var. botrytis]|uniref:(rape) hypothetical protein n=1 Tax=Brassica napus TaxID=3708 RepID=A0A816J4U2_BRANA|nr:unnamed protein product [Brassica napus]